MTRSTAVWLAVAGFVVAISSGAATPEDAIVGVWLTESGDSKVDIARQGAAYTGKVVWLKQADGGGKQVLDARNADPALRGRPIMGLDVLSGLRYAGAGVWKGGTVYSPRKGRAYPVELTLAADGKLNVKAKDGILSKTVQWTR
jgi:uncharacterized protein (DUF2147 family)